MVHPIFLRCNDGSERIQGRGTHANERLDPWNAIFGSGNESNEEDDSRAASSDNVLMDLFSQWSSFHRIWWVVANGIIPRIVLSSMDPCRPGRKVCVWP
jgi:hypothetical protein